MREHEESCPREREILAAFHEGEPERAGGDAGAHLESCPACRRALRQARELDALIAARTDTDMEEARADELLAFLRQEELVAAGGRGRSRRLLAVGALVLVVGVTAGVLAHFARGGRTLPVPVAPGIPPETARGPVAPTPVESEEPATPEGEKPAEQVAGTAGRVSSLFSALTVTLPGDASPRSPGKERKLFTGEDHLAMARRATPLFSALTVTLPGDASPPAPDEERKVFSEEDYLAAFRGAGPRDLGRERLAAEADRILQEADDREPERVLAAAEWFLEGGGNGLTRPERLPILGRLVRAGRPGLSGPLAERLRSHPGLLRRLASAATVARGEAALAQAEINGALGNPAALRPLLRCPDPVQEAAARAAARAGSRASLTFLLDLHLERAARFSHLAAPHLLFAELPPRLVEPFTVILERRIEETNRRDRARFCQDVLEFLNCRRGGLL